jgi:hypothetical protein
MDPTVMGTAVTYLSISTVSPVLILKDPIQRSKKAEGVFTHAICMDGAK